MLKAAIIDGYIDEPTCLGVPPYISPYPRYIAGAFWKYNPKIDLKYFTIDQIRNDPKIISYLSKNDIVIIIAGMAVPGRYLSGYPASPNEVERIVKQLEKPIKILSGPAAKYGFGLSGGKKIREINPVFDLIVKGDCELIVYDLLNQKLKIDEIEPNSSRKNAQEIANFAKIGANIVSQHPNFPDYLIAEIETYRGCPRTIVGGCSFCSEPAKGLPDFREIKDIIKEIKELYKSGVRHFRLGNQPCIFSYMSKEAGKKEFPRPNPKALEDLFSKIRKVAPKLRTLHIDNANPGVIAKYPKESVLIAKTIVKYHTAGDVAAFGVESVDPAVIKENNLKASAQEILFAIKLLNKIGRKQGSNGMPELLPGLNFVFGLKAETKKTFELDYEFLEDIYKKDLLLRRINLRQIIPIPNTKMYEYGLKLVNKHKAEFKRFKKKVNENIQRPMLKKLLPPDTVLKNIYLEKLDGKLTFGRQMGSYPLLVGIPGIYELFDFIDVKIVDYGYRSVTAIPYPFDLNNAPRQTIEAIPGVGKKRAIRILANRPFKNVKELSDCLDDLQIVKIITNYSKL